MHASTILRATSRVRIGRISSADAGIASSVAKPVSSVILPEMFMVPSLL